MAKQSPVYLVRRGDKVYALTREGMTMYGNPKYKVHSVPYQNLERDPQRGAWADTYDFTHNEAINYNSPEQYIDEFIKNYSDKKPSAKGKTEMVMRDGKLVGYSRDKNTPSGNPAHQAFVGNIPEEGKHQSTSRQRVQTGYESDIAGQLIKKLGGLG